MVSAILTTAIPPAYFDHNRQIVTRFQARRIRAIFPFLKLAAELRSIIYDISIDTNAAQKILDRYYQSVRNASPRGMHAVLAPLVWSKCPTILLINRQIFVEASFLLRKRVLTFDHGLLDMLTVQDFVADSAFRNVSSIVIDDSGHKLLQDNIMVASWLGYMTLLHQLAQVLKGGHKLKKLTISFTDKTLVQHVTTCMHMSYKCGFRDSMIDVCNALRGVRNIGSVTLVGFPPLLAPELKMRMESAPLNFLELPRELRDMIYGEALDWSDVTPQLFRTLANWIDKSKPALYPKRSTPTILLLNRQITAEALIVLRVKPAVFICPSNHNMQLQRLVPSLARFITPTTLQHVQHLVLHLESWEWIHSLHHLLPSFATTGTKAGQTHSLKTLHLHFRDDLKARFMINASQQYPDDTLHSTLSRLANIRGLQRVTFTGDLPACYTLPLAQIMQMPALAADSQMPELMTLRGDGVVVPVMALHHDE